MNCLSALGDARSTLLSDGNRWAVPAASAVPSGKVLEQQCSPLLPRTTPIHLAKWCAGYNALIHKHAPKPTASCGFAFAIGDSDLPIGQQVFLPIEKNHSISHMMHATIVAVRQGTHILKLVSPLTFTNSIDVLSLINDRIAVEGPMHLLQCDLVWAYNSDFKLHAKVFGNSTHGRKSKGVTRVDLSPFVTSLASPFVGGLCFR
jgi:hypothetical protein